MFSLSSANSASIDAEHDPAQRRHEEQEHRQAHRVVHGNRLGHGGLRLRAGGGFGSVTGRGSVAGRRIGARLVGPDHVPWTGKLVRGVGESFVDVGTHGIRKNRPKTLILVSGASGVSGASEVSDKRPVEAYGFVQGVPAGFAPGSFVAGGRGRGGSVAGRGGPDRASAARGTVASGAGCAAGVGVTSGAASGTTGIGLGWAWVPGMGCAARVGGVVARGSRPAWRTHPPGRPSGSRQAWRTPPGSATRGEPSGSPGPASAAAVGAATTGAGGRDCGWPVVGLLGGRVGGHAGRRACPLVGRGRRAAVHRRVAMG